MAILINDNYSLQAQNKAFDARYLDVTTPWATVAAAKAGIPTYRYTGLTVNVAGDEYWWKTGVLDNDLIQKSLGGVSNITGATNGLSLTGGGTQVALGGALTGNTTISASTHTFNINRGTTGTSLSFFNYLGLVNAVSLSTDHGLYSTCILQASNTGITNSADVLICANDTTQHSQINVTNTALTLLKTNAANSAQQRINLGHATWGILIQDTCGSVGMAYCANYCTNGQSNPRWIPDNAYVTGLTAGESNTVAVCNVTTIYTATTSNDFIGVSGASLIYLPPVPKACQRISVADICGNALGAPITVCGCWGSNGQNINGDTFSTINTDYGSMTFINNGNTWSAVAFIN